MSILKGMPARIQTPAILCLYTLQIFVPFPHHLFLVANNVVMSTIHGQRISQLCMATAVMVTPGHTTHPPLASQSVGGHNGLIQSPISQELFILQESEYHRIRMEELRPICNNEVTIRCHQTRKKRQPWMIIDAT